jgi:excisionase family DNA binding protein
VEPLLTLEEVQERLRIGRMAVRRLINEDPNFRTVKLGRRRLMTEQALAEYVQSREERFPGVPA